MFFNVNFFLKKQPFHDPLKKNTTETIPLKHNKTIVFEFQIRKSRFLNKHSMKTQYHRYIHLRQVISKRILNQFF